MTAMRHEQRIPDSGLASGFLLPTSGQVAVGHGRMRLSDQSAHRFGTIAWVFQLSAAVIGPRCDYHDAQAAALSRGMAS